MRWRIFVSLSCLKIFFQILEGESDALSEGLIGAMVSAVPAPQNIDRFGGSR
jgi:hypothetical protein